jgi:alpha-L-rhamnosidase
MNARPLRMARSIIVGCTLSAAALLALAAPSLAHAGASSLSRHAVAGNPGWQRYVLDQGNGLVYPKRVYVVGDASAVQNPTGLEAQGGGVTTIHATGQGAPQLVLDLGINTGGYVEIGITKSDGTTVHLGYSEARRFLTPDGDTGASQVPPAVAVPFVVDPSLGNDDDPTSRYDDISTAGAWRSPAIRGAQRWISLQLQGAGTVSIDYVRIREEHSHPATADYVGHFLSSDDVLNRLWYATAYTFALDSFKDLRPGHNKGNVVVTDGAKRDRLVWLGDLVIENLIGEYSYRQARQIVHDSIQIFACQQTSEGLIAPNSQIELTCPNQPPAPQGTGGGPASLPEYTAWWVAALHDYNLFTGDDGFARRMLPVARRAMAYFTANLDSNGLYSTPPGVINWHPFDNAAGEDTHTNTVIYRALLDLADLERRVGGGQPAAAQDTQAAARLRAAILTHLWDPAASAFLLNSQDPQANHTQDAQVEAVLDGVVTGTQAASALAFVDHNLETTYGVRNGQSNNDPYMSNYISPYISSTELLARLNRHDTLGALSLLHREWGQMVNTDPNTTLWEKMSFAGDAASYSPNQLGAGTVPSNSGAGPGITSLAHGWAGGPVAALSGYLLGIRPTAPGFSSWIVEPQVGDLRFAQGQAPTPHGVVVSRWRRGRGLFVLTAGGPRGTSGTVAVPELGARRTIAIDGRIVWRAGVHARGIHALEQNGEVLFGGIRGVHTFAWG